MKRILVYGLKEPIGGVENMVLSYTSRFPADQLVCDYLFFGSTFSRESEISHKEGRAFYLPNRIKRRREYLAKLNEIFSHTQYDAVWANFAGLTNIDVLKFGKKYRVPIRIAHSHGARLYWDGKLMKYVVPIFHTFHKSRISQFATHFWACSETAGKFMFPCTVHNRVTVIKNAVDITTFCENPDKRIAMRKKLGVETALVIGHVARMSAEKNQGFLLDVFKELHNRRSDARLLFVGDGELNEILVEKARALDIREQVIFAGFQTNVADYYRASDVFVMPSLSEGLGMSLIEAQACGVPCVASYEVPKEVNVTGKVRFVRLDASISHWCDEIEKLAGDRIHDAVSAVQRAGYSVQLEAKKLSSFFIKGESL